jgi:predicted alpha-1,2-mannosidase
VVDVEETLVCENLIMMTRCLLLSLVCPLTIAAQDVTQFVDPFIGTGEFGHTFPGAVHPWGMVSVSPHNAPGTPSGYRHGEPFFHGFGQTHLSGTGCADLGSIVVTAVRDSNSFDPEKYKCTYRDERAFPGYYSVRLNEPGVFAEATATPRCGFLQVTPENDDNLTLVIDAGRSLALLGGGAVTIRSSTEVEGYNLSGGFCGEANRQTVYFVARFSQPAVRSGILVNAQRIAETSAAVEDQSIGAWLQFSSEPGKAILMKVGISYVSIANARQNLDAEIPDWNFNRVRVEAQNEWNRELSRIEVEGGSRDDKVKFYTALYHTLIHPNIISDVNGEYPLMGRNGVGKVSGRERYTIFSLWDTYRTLHPFLALVYPERQVAMVQSMVNMYRESGFLPKWELAGNETYMMVGDPAAIVIADTYLKGIDDFDVALAYEAITKPALLRDGEEAPPIRAGYHEQLQYGYIPFEQDTTQDWWVWGPVSTSLEYCLSDWAIGRMAEKLGRTGEAQEFFRRSQFYKNYFDPSTQFLRPKRKSGEWLAPFDSLALEGSGSWAWSGGPGYVEGNAWHYTWFVPHDVEGLIDLFGGPQPFVKKMQRCFDEQHFTIGNEPDIAYPYLFTYVDGEEWRAQRTVAQIMKDHFSTGPNGLRGDDDAGAISAWFVFSALGFYPACPASNEYRLGIPLFDRASISLSPRFGSGEEFVIEKIGDEERVKAIQLNGGTVTDFKIDHSQIVAGGKLVFEMK